MGYRTRNVQKSRRVQKQRQVPNGSGGFTIEPYWDTETYTTTEQYYVPDTSSSSSYDSGSSSSSSYDGGSSSSDSGGSW